MGVGHSILIDVEYLILRPGVSDPVNKVRCTDLRGLSGGDKGVVLPWARYGSLSVFTFLVLFYEWV